MPRLMPILRSRLLGSYSASKAVDSVSSGHLASPQIKSKPNMDKTTP